MLPAVSGACSGPMVRTPSIFMWWQRSVHALLSSRLWPIAQATSMTAANENLYQCLTFILPMTAGNENHHLCHKPAFSKSFNFQSGFLLTRILSLLQFKQGSYFMPCQGLSTGYKILCNPTCGNIFSILFPVTKFLLLTIICAN